ncbi:MAG TPA: nitrous oxide reductase family maturation protein NosD [Flavilitoribacter sp.]|nr:nitrous oxide reductase family maturation protein NosD [Flavilitoribacter sp.]HMQ89283.1 nitrous oxide reductase family maturation protein NosD [Flavilitoribacter sp.]
MKYLFIIWIFISTACQSKGESRVLEVGSDSPFTTIRQAVHAALPGDEVLVCPGIYKEGQIIIDKKISITGQDFPILDGQNKSEVLTIVCDSVSVTGLLIRNVGTSHIEDRAGIRVRKSGHFSICGNILSNTFFGIYLEHARDGLVENNEIQGEALQENTSGNAIHLWYCNNIRVDGNRVGGHRDGIYLEFVNNSLISGNVSRNNLRYGLHFMFSNEDNYFNNRFSGNGAGVAVMFSKKINMWDNVFEQNQGRASYGLLLKEIYDASIYRNTFTENTIGIHVEGCARVNYKHNDFLNNGWALKMAGGCLDNAFTANNFVSNTFDLSTGSFTETNGFDGNYWNDYTGYDLDKDNIGDVPYHPVKLFSYVVTQTPESIVLLHSVFVELINFSEKVSPLFTPANVADHHPLMHYINWEEIQQ